jgi:PBP1b-binding outer membrane lipoprotein LpoB
MKKLSLLSLLTVTSLVLAGCGQTSDTTPPTPSANSNSIYTISAEFAKQFEACESNPGSCDLDRDQVIEGIITKIYEPGYGDLSNFVDITNAE